MGRKKSFPPEPLKLMNGGTHHGQQRQHQNQIQIQQQQQDRPDTYSVRSKPTHVAQTQQRLGETDQRMSPAPTASPNSPRSPFSKYNNSHQPHPQKPQSKQQPNLQHLQQTPASSPDYDSSATTTATATTTTTASIASSTNGKQPHIAELQQPQQQPLRDQSRFPPITSTTSASPPKPPKAQTHERRLKSSHGRRHDDDKHAPKQGFFFNFSKTAKSSDRLPIHSQGLQNASLAREAMNGADQPAVAKPSSKQSDTIYVDPAQRAVPSLPSKSDTSLVSSADGDPNSNHSHATKKSGKPKPFTLLSRSKSHREKDGRSPRHTPSPQDLREPIPGQMPTVELERPERAHVASTPKTAPVPNDRAYREAMSSASRNHSSDRASSRDASSDRRGHSDRDHGKHHQQSMPRDGNNGSSSFFGNLRREGGRVAESIGKGLFGKGGRSASTTEREPVVDDEHYVLKVINQPLVKQTRLTRISKRLEESRDKTEFWMPAFPWRAIDYLNYKGCDVEGLYRVPGSGPQIKKWQRRFDEQYDVDLFTCEDLYDINIIGSMLKAWLRELPDELFPKEAQDRIARECAGQGSDKVPQMLVEELSNLSPFNYYLLFAITCHLSLLLAHSDKNKMDFRNLCICFQPCMKIDAFCFKFLVCDWRDCWKGCKTEGKYIEEEYKLFDQPPPPGLGVRKKLEARVEPRADRRPSPSPTPDRDDAQSRKVSSSDSNSKKSAESRHKKKGQYAAHENGKENGNAAPKPAHPEISISDANSDPQGANDIRPLSPIKPLSPLGF